MSTGIQVSLILPLMTLKHGHNVGVLKSCKHLITSKESALDDAIDFFESFDSVIPTDRLYSEHPRPPNGLDWFECNMADLLGLEPQLTDTLLMPPQFEVYEARKRPSVLLQPDQPINFDIEEGSVSRHDAFY